jgi:hypothetical protein
MSAYGQPTPPPAPQKKGSGCAKIGCLGAVAVLVVIGVAAVATNKTTTSSSSDGTTVTTSGGQSAPTTKAAAPAKPTVVLTAHGSGIKNTAPFTTGDNWTVTYTFDCTGFGQAGNFMVSDENDMPLVNELKLKGTGSTPQYNAGTHHLQINSECDWTLTVTNG